MQQNKQLKLPQNEGFVNGFLSASSFRIIPLTHPAAISTPLQSGRLSDEVSQTTYALSLYDAPSWAERSRGRSDSMFVARRRRIGSAALDGSRVAVSYAGWSRHLCLR